MVYKYFFPQYTVLLIMVSESQSVWPSSYSDHREEKQTLKHSPSATWPPATHNLTSCSNITASSSQSFLSSYSSCPSSAWHFSFFKVTHWNAGLFTLKAEQQPVKIQMNQVVDFVVFCCSITCRNMQTFCTLRMLNSYLECGRELLFPLLFWHIMG